MNNILDNIEIKSATGDTTRSVSNITFDSREVKKGDLFIAVKGTRTDGHDYISSAIEKGAAAIVCEYVPEGIYKDTVFIKVADSAKALGIIAANYFDNPSGKLTVVAVTGTNGKTTVVSLLYGLFKRLGSKTGAISTVNNVVDDEVIASTHTTPDAIRINQLLSRMVERGCNYCFMEASSHAIDQERMYGIRLTGAIYTNMSHDHLDYHKSFDGYLKAKKKLFDGLPSSAFALINADDKYGKIMLQNTQGLKSFYSLNRPAEFRAKVVSNTLEGLEMEIEGEDVWFKLIGHYNAYNILAALGCAVLLGEDKKEAMTALSDIDPAPGRFDQVLRSETGIKAFVDYAHTPEALKNVLYTLNECRTGNETLITVVGCGGNRDRQKRPLMASIACKLSDKVILTSDNPRDEDPDEILKDMQEGVSTANRKKTLTITDRKEAIKTACMMAKDSDIILVAGKGHEKYQEIKGVRHPFDDKVVLGEMLAMN